MNLPLVRLLHLSSPALPVGAYAYSQGLELAVHEEWIRDEADALSWILGLATNALGTLDLPLLARLHAAWSAGDTDGVRRSNEWLLAARGTRELRAEDRHLGGALARILAGLGISDLQHPALEAPAFATAFALAAVRWHIEARDAMAGYLWSWTENQALAAVKLVPLGQSAGQRILHEAAGRIPAIVERAGGIDDAEIGTGAFSQAIASARHETQYTRLFRS